jgi:hypothetical protein
MAIIATAQITLMVISLQLGLANYRFPAFDGGIQVFYRKRKWRREFIAAP